MKALSKWFEVDFSLDINILKMIAVLIAITTFQECFLGSIVLLMPDTTIPLAICLIMQHILLWAELHIVGKIRDWKEEHARPA